VEEELRQKWFMSKELKCGHVDYKKQGSVAKAACNPQRKVMVLSEVSCRLLFVVLGFELEPELMHF
jgi:hypothetical protein